MTNILQLEHVTYAYDRERLALDDVSLTIKKGERIAVIGNNGAGKSTFFLTCNGVLQPRSGEVLYSGEKINHRKREDLSRLRRAVGIVFQDADNQIIASTVPGEISFGPMNLGLSKEEVAQRVEAAIDDMHLEAFRNRAPQYLSGGEKKRVSIADILAMHPEIILFDEPTASLDPQNSRLLEETLNRLSKTGITLVVSTHDMDLALRFADRVLVFSGGKLLCDATPEQVFQNDALLAEAGLQKPTLFQVAQMLGISSCPKDLQALQTELEKHQ